MWINDQASGNTLLGLTRWMWEVFLKLPATWIMLFNYDLPWNPFLLSRLLFVFVLGDLELIKLQLKIEQFYLCIAMFISQVLAEKHVLVNLQWPDQQIKCIYMELKLNPVNFAFISATERVVKLFRLPRFGLGIGERDLVQELVFDSCRTFKQLRIKTCRAPMDVNRSICHKATMRHQQTGLSIAPKCAQQQECSNHFPLNACNTALPYKMKVAIFPPAEMTAPAERMDPQKMVGI